MSLRFRKSVTIIPGLRLNFNKNSTSLSFGVPGARMSVNTKGDIYRSFGVPGTGLYDVQRISGKSRQRAREAAMAPDPDVVAPDFFEGGAEEPITLGVFAKKFEKDFDKAVNTFTLESLKKYQVDYPEYALAAKAFTITLLMSEAKTFEEGMKVAAEIWEKRHELLEDYLWKRYSKHVKITAPIAPGIEIKTVWTMKALGLVYSEGLQAQKKYQEALDVVEEIQQDITVQVATCELEIQLRKFDEVINTTDDVENVDDPSAVLLIFRGIALREKGLYDAAIEVFKLARAKKDRSEIILNKALFERAQAYAASGKKAMARKDYEKILVTDGSYEGVADKLAELGTADAN
jgi:tetratricopeptide (TPR) repeat protein